MQRTVGLAMLRALWLETCLKSLLLFLIAGIALLLLRRASAATRHLVWRTTLLGLFLLPLLSRTLPVWRLTVSRVAPPAPRRSPLAYPQEKPIPTVFRSDRVATVRAPGSSPSPVPALPSTAVPAPVVSAHPTKSVWSHSLSFWTRLGALLWLTGALVVLARVANGLRQLRRIERRCRPMDSEVICSLAGKLAAEIGLKRPVVMLDASGTPFSMPMTWGYLHPRVLLPEGAPTWPEARLSAVLLHEFAHIRRRDWPIQLFAHLVCALYWFHPLVWLAAARMQQESERASDDCVLAAGMKPSDYAEALLDIVRTRAGSGGAWRFMVTMAQTTRIEGRLQAILDARLCRRSPSPFRRRVALYGALGGMALLATLQVAARPVSAPPSVSAAPAEATLPERKALLMETRLTPATTPRLPQGEPIGRRSAGTPAWTLTPMPAERRSVVASSSPPLHATAPGPIHWGAVEGGLQAGIALVGKKRSFTPGEKVPLQTYIRNTTDHEIGFAWAGDVYMDALPRVQQSTPRGTPKQKRVLGVFLTGIPSCIVQTLQPGETLVIPHPGLALGKIEGKSLEPYPYLEEPTEGTYTVTQDYEYHLLTPAEVQDLHAWLDPPPWRSQGAWKTPAEVQDLHAGLDKNPDMGATTMQETFLSAQGKSSQKQVMIASLPAYFRATFGPQEKGNTLGSGAITFVIGTPDAKPGEAKNAARVSTVAPGDYHWGKAVNGLQLGVRFQGGKTRYRLGEVATQELAVRNVSEQPLTFLALMFPFNQDQPVVSTLEGKTMPVSAIWYTGIEATTPQTLGPGKTLVVARPTLEIPKNPEKTGDQTPVLQAGPGRYRLYYLRNIRPAGATDLKTPLETEFLEFEILAANH